MTSPKLALEIEATTGSEFLRYAEGLIDVYAGEEGVLLTVRRKPRSINHVRSVELTADEASEVGEALLAAAAHAKKAREPEARGLRYPSPSKTGKEGNGRGESDG